MESTSPLVELLLRWRELQQEGPAITPEELCAEWPELLPEFKRQIAALESMEALVAETTTDSSATAPAVGGATEHPSSVPGYEILSELGRGGMGVVYKARQLGLKRLVALKMILAGSHAGTDQRARFRLEAEAVARLQHPNIVQIHEIGESGGLPFFSLEFVAGGSLERKLAGTPQPSRETAGLVELIARATHAAHEKGIIHRDLKPANVLVTAAGIPKITDFGLAKQLDEPGQTASEVVVGTPSYMAPEQAAGPTREPGPSVDIYALGAILYEMLTGRPPFKGATVLDTLDQVKHQEPVPPNQLQPKLPRDLETICLKCLRKEAAQRYGSALELADDLRRFLDGQPILARPVGIIGRTWRWCRRNRAVAAMILAMSATLLAGTAVSIWQAVRATRERDDKEKALQAETRARTLAMNALRKLTNDFVGRQLTRRAQLTDQERRFLRDILPLYEEFAALPGPEVEQRAIRAEGYFGIGRIQYALSRAKEAEWSYQQAVTVLEQLVADFPARLEFRHDLAKGYGNLALLLQEEGRPKEAEAASDAALVLLRPLVADFPDNQQYRQDLAGFQANAGIRFRATRQRKEAMGAFSEALTILQELAPSSPTDAGRSHMLAEAHNNLGALLFEKGELKAAEGHYRKAQVIRKQLASASPTDTEFLHGLATINYNLGLLLRGMNRFKEAEVALNDALAAQKQLAREFPGNREFQEDLAATRNSLRWLLVLMGRPKEAEAVFKDQEKNQPASPTK